MKKGCFISFVVIFTLVVGVIVYFIKYKKDILKEYSKEKLVEIVVNEFDNKIKDVRQSVYKDSMKFAIHDFVKTTKELKFDSTMARLKNILSEAKLFYKDGNIDSLDYHRIKIVLNRYERSKKN